MSDGTVQHLTADRVQRAGERFDQDLAYAEKAEEHLWIVAVAHRITEEGARAYLAGETVILDAESVSITGVGCYRCEQPFSPRLAGKRCRGES